MPTRTFAITADDKSVVLDTKGTAELTINVSNTAARPIRGQAKLVPVGATKADWLRINGEVERNFSANEAHQFVVRMTVAPGAPVGKYPFRLNVLSVQNPDDDFTEGPVVSFELREAPPPPPPDHKFPWFYVILALIVLIGGVTVYLLLTAKIVVPDVEKQTLNDASNLLTKAELKVEATELVSGTNPAGTVVTQDPAAGEKVAKDTVVNLTVAKAPAASPPPSLPKPNPTPAPVPRASSIRAVTVALGAWGPLTAGKPANYKGGLDFDGHGPKIVWTVQLSIVGGNKIEASVSYNATQWDTKNNRADSNPVEASGEWNNILVYTDSNPGENIVSIGKTVDSGQLVEQKSGLKTAVKGLLYTYLVQGDGAGNDIGKYTTIQTQGTGSVSIEVQSSQ
jgi:hypothetical protein